MGVFHNGEEAGGAADGTVGGAGGGDGKTVQLTECFKHVVDICDHGEEAGGSADGASRGMGLWGGNRGSV